MKHISIDNGKTMMTAAEAIDYIVDFGLWEQVVQAMEANARYESNARAGASCKREQLECYLDVAESDLIVDACDTVDFSRDVDDHYDFIDLFQLTGGREFGIIVTRGSENSTADVSVCALDAVRLDDKITPCGKSDDVRDLLPGSIAYWGDDDDDQPAGSPHYYGDRNIYVDNMGISRDEFDDLPALFGIRTKHNAHVVFERGEDGSLLPTSGEYWEIGDNIVIITPDGWN